MKFTTPCDSVQFTMALTLDSTGVSTLVMVQLGFGKKIQEDLGLQPENEVQLL